MTMSMTKSKLLTKLCQRHQTPTYLVLAKNVDNFGLTLFVLVLGNSAYLSLSQAIIYAMQTPTVISFRMT